MTSDSYIIGGGRAGFDRLALLHRVMAGLTDELFDRVGITAGQRCLDVGCGNGAVTRMLAQRVGPEGLALGIDIDPVKIELATAEAEAEGLTQLRFAVGDVAGIEAAVRGAAPAFDRIHARFLLSHLTDPAAAVAAMAGLLAPGGALMVMDVDFSAAFCEPPHPAFDRYTELYVTAARGRGADPLIGPKLPRLLDAAGLAGIEMAVAQPTGMRAEGASGESKRLVAVTMELITDAVVAAGLTTTEEAAALAEALHGLAGDDRVVMSNPRIVRAWGYRPG